MKKAILLDETTATVKGCFEKSDILFEFKAHEEFFHRHIPDISESHSVRLPEDKILSATMKLGKKSIFSR